MKPFPETRKDKLVVREFADELLVYNKERHEAHCLNRAAAVILKHCDGHTSIRDIARHVAADLQIESALIDEQVIWYALEQFKRDHLIEELESPAAMLNSTGGAMNRRHMMRVLGLTAVIALPLVTSIVAPTSAQAASCFHANSPCVSNAQCCSGVCTSNACVGG